MGWYHGTINELEPGTVLVPAAQNPGSSRYECTTTGPRSEVVWITPIEDEAFMWAEFAAEMDYPADAILYVYEVKPSANPIVWDDPEVDSCGDPLAEYTCPTATITRLVAATPWED